MLALLDRRRRMDAMCFIWNLSLTIALRIVRHCKARHHFITYPLASQQKTPSDFWMMIFQPEMLLATLLLLHGPVFVKCVTAPPAFEATKQADIVRSISDMPAKAPVSSDDENYMQVFDRIHRLAENRDQFFARAKADSALPAGSESQQSVDYSIHSQIKKALIEGVALEHAASSSLLDADVGAAKSLIELAAEKQIAAENLQQQLINDRKKLFMIEDLEKDKKYKENTKKLSKAKENLEALPDLKSLYERFQQLHKARLAAVKSWKNPLHIREKPKGLYFWLKHFLKTITLYNLFVREFCGSAAIDLMSHTVELENQALVHIITNERAVALRHLKVGEYMLEMAKNTRDRAYEAGYGPIDMVDYPRYTQAASTVDSQRINHLTSTSLSGISHKVNEIDQISLHLLKKLEDTGTQEETVASKTSEVKKD